ncbi:hypothetical protein Tco_1107508 [Tanacetum coccineum]
MHHQTSNLLPHEQVRLPDTKAKRSPNQLLQSESVSEEDSDPEQARRDKDMQKNLALLAKYFKKLYKPTNNNLRTSSNSKNKTEDTTPRKPKRVKDYAYHKEKMMMCKQAEQGVPLQAEQADWLEDTDEEIDEQELEAHYSYMAKIQEVSPAESSSTDTPLEQIPYDTSDPANRFAPDGEEIVTLSEENKTILDSHCFIHELKKEMNDDLEYVNSLEKELDELESEKADFSNIYDLLLEECVSKDVTCSYLHSLSDLNANTELPAL